MNKKKAKPWLSRSYQIHMYLWFVLSDLFSLVVSGVLAYFLRMFFSGKYMHSEVYFQMLWLPLVFILFYAVFGLYPGVGITPFDEVKRTTMVSSSLWIALTAILFMTQSGEQFSRGVFFFNFLLSLVFVPSFRFIARRFGRKFGYWGEPVAIIGLGDYGKKALHYLLNAQYFGFIPVMVVDDKFTGNEFVFEKYKLSTITGNALLADPTLLNQQGVSTVFFTPDETSSKLSRAIGFEDRFGIKNLILLSRLGWVVGSAVLPVDMEGLLGLSVQRNLINPFYRLIKRLIDLLITTIAAIITMPIMLVSALLIKLDSPGPVFYTQKRIGFHGKEINVLKFRTMIPNADTILENYLQENSELREQWHQTHKLKNDPRVTRLGQFLRKSSIDELPQMWNVLTGDMSWVGPRPIVQDEVIHYQESLELYKQVRPGITGLWQSSGRSSTSYNYRVKLDEYYIRHWSVWLDLYILLRTVRSVLKHEGAW